LQSPGSTPFCSHNSRSGHTNLDEEEAFIASGEAMTAYRAECTLGTATRLAEKPYPRQSTLTQVVSSTNLEADERATMTVKYDDEPI
jgi:hypothetical protein